MKRKHLEKLEKQLTSLHKDLTKTLAYLRESTDDGSKADLGSNEELNPQPLPPKKNKLKADINPQPLPPQKKPKTAINPQPLPPQKKPKTTINPQPLPPRAKAK